ncbi:MAG: hypothetical protein H7Z72_21960 [Bacteroidetes bacterium]|nr:hypothetical protein [Fibrella sp.]
MENTPNIYLESEEWVDCIERELMGINPPEETRLLTSKLSQSADLAEAIEIIRLSRRVIANELTQLSIQRAMDSVSQPTQPTSPPGMNWREPAPPPPPPPPPIRRRINHLVVLGLFAGMLITVISIRYISVHNDRPQYISLTTPADTALVRQVIDEQLVISYLVAETKGADVKQLSMARQLILTDPAATDSVLTLLSNVKDDATFEVSFLRGYVLLKDPREKPSEAITALQQASQSLDARLQDEARWYLGLAYLKNMDLAKAYPLFTQIANSSSGHRRYAQEIVDALTRR